MGTFSMTPGSIGFSLGSDRSGHAPAGFRNTVDRKLRTVVREILNTVVRWQKRYEMRQTLLTMEDTVLKDIGHTRSEVRREAQKMFRLY